MTNTAVATLRLSLLMFTKLLTIVLTLSETLPVHALLQIYQAITMLRVLF